MSQLTTTDWIESLRSRNAVYRVDHGDEYLLFPFAHRGIWHREFQVMRLFAAGKTSSEIAEELSITPSTVNTYRMRIFERMKTKSNVELSHYAVEHELIE